MRTAFALLGLILSVSLTSAQTRGRKIQIAGTIVTVPSGTRFALATKLGIYSIDAKAASLSLGGKAMRLSDLRASDALSIVGTVAMPATGRATIVATRIEVAARPGSGTSRARPALKRA